MVLRCKIQYYCNIHSAIISSIGTVVSRANKPKQFVGACNLQALSLALGPGLHMQPKTPLGWHSNAVIGQKPVETRNM